MRDTYPDEAPELDPTTMLWMSLMGRVLFSIVVTSVAVFLLARIIFQSSIGTGPTLLDPVIVMGREAGKGFADVSRRVSGTSYAADFLPSLVSTRARRALSITSIDPAAAAAFASFRRRYMTSYDFTSGLAINFYYEEERWDNKTPVARKDKHKTERHIEDSPSLSDCPKFMPKLDSVYRNHQCHNRSHHGHWYGYFEWKRV